MPSPRPSTLPGVGLILTLALAALALTAPARAAGPVCSVAPAGGTYTSVAAALADAGCATIQVAAGTFETNVTISRAVVIEGAGAASTRLDGGGMSRFTRVITVENASGPVELRNLTIANGDAGQLIGGGIYNNSTLTLTNVSVEGNAGGNAGGIRNEGAMTIVNSTIAENRGRSIGGILNDGTLTIRGSRITANQGRAASALLSTAQLTVVDTTIAGNISESGPAVNTFSGSATIESTAIVGNSGGGGDQGLPAGLLNSAGVTLTLKGSTLLSNGPGANCQGAITSQGGNLSDDASCGAAATVVQGQLFLPSLQR